MRLLGGWVEERVSGEFAVSKLVGLVLPFLQV